MVNTVEEVEKQQIIEAYKSRLCSGPEMVAAAVVNTVVEVEDPVADYSSSKHLKVVFGQGQRRWRLL